VFEPTLKVTLWVPKKPKPPKIRSKSKDKNEGTIENKSFSLIHPYSKNIFKPYTSPLGPPKAQIR